ncbi:hypothetical protein HCU64_00115 [Methylobacterium sp. C25]|nr:hypothetical protein [Methylobacterium sp. C25]
MSQEREAPAADDVMQQPWCCLVCSSRFRFGKIILRGGSLVRPKCEGVSGLHPADGTVKEIGEYQGEIGTRN